MQKLVSLVLFLGASSAVAACASSEASPEPATAASAQPASATDAAARCVEVMTRNRTCTDAYIPALVDARARHDHPAGIADAVKTNRDGVIAEAKTEWQSDSTDSAIAAMCAQVTADAVAAADLEQARTCLAETACDPYVACVMPLFEKRFVK